MKYLLIDTTSDNYYRSFYLNYRFELTPTSYQVNLVEFTNCVRSLDYLRKIKNYKLMPEVTIDKLRIVSINDIPRPNQQL